MQAPSFIGWFRHVGFGVNRCLRIMLVSWLWLVPMVGMVGVSVQSRMAPETVSSVWDGLRELGMRRHGDGQSDSGEVARLRERRYREVLQEQLCDAWFAALVPLERTDERVIAERFGS